MCCYNDRCACRSESRKDLHSDVTCVADLLYLASILPWRESTVSIPPGGFVQSLFGRPRWATSASERLLCNRPSETHAESEKIILFELPSLTSPQSVFCWVTLFWRRLEQTVNVPTCTCLNSHTLGMQEEEAASQHRNAACVFWSPNLQGTLVTQPVPGPLWLFWYLSSLNQCFLAKYVYIYISHWLLMSWVTPVVTLIRYAGG